MNLHEQEKLLVAQLQIKQKEVDLIKKKLAEIRGKLAF